LQIGDFLTGKGVKITKKPCPDDKFVAGYMGSTGKILKPLPWIRGRGLRSCMNGYNKKTII